MPNTAPSHGQEEPRTNGHRPGLRLVVEDDAGRAGGLGEAVAVGLVLVVAVLIVIQLTSWYVNAALTVVP